MISWHAGRREMLGSGSRRAATEKAEKHRGNRKLDELLARRTQSSARIGKKPRWHGGRNDAPSGPAAASSGLSQAARHARRAVEPYRTTTNLDVADPTLA